MKQIKTTKRMNICKSKHVQGKARMVMHMFNLKEG